MLCSDSKSLLNLYYSTHGFVSRANVVKRKTALTKSRSCLQVFLNYAFCHIRTFPETKKETLGKSSDQFIGTWIMIRPIPKGVWQGLLAQLALGNPEETTRFHANLWFPKQITRMFNINMFDVSPCEKEKNIMVLFSSVAPTFKCTSGEIEELPKTFSGLWAAQPCRVMQSCILVGVSRLSSLAVMIWRWGGQHSSSFQ